MADLYKILHILIVPMNSLEEHEKGMTNSKEKVISFHPRLTWNDRLLQVKTVTLHRESVWPSGKALDW